MRGHIPRTTANSWASTVVKVLATEYPASMHHESAGPDDVTVIPSELHPAFHGAYDWHSSVHMLASGVQLLNYSMQKEQWNELAQIIDARLTPDNIAAEVEYLKAHPLFERPYGWAWATQLVRACRASKLSVTDVWAEALEPLATHLDGAIDAWLGAQRLPARHGNHENSAFSLYLMYEAAGDETRAHIASRAREWYGGDTDYPYRYELGGTDFLPNGLCEAVLMQRVLEPEEFHTWLEAFFPDAEDAVRYYTQVPEAQDATDGKLAHTYGLALTRAWMLRLLQKELPGNMRSLTYPLVAAAREHVEGDNFASTHWLITYALLALRADTL